MTIISRAEVRLILVAWQRGELTHEQVYDWANDRWAVEGIEPADEVVAEILSSLDILDINQIVTDDVPIFLEALGTQDESAALGRIGEYFEKIDFAARTENLRTVPFYARVLCTPPS